MKRLSLSVKLPLLFIISILIIMLVVVIAVHTRFQNRMIEEYSRMAKGVTQLLADRIDGDRVDEYMELNYSLDDYNSIIEYMYKLKADYPDVLYLYAYRCEEDGGHMIFDIDAEEVDNGEAYEVGYVYELDEPFASHISDIMAGEETEGYAVHTQEDGYLYSYCRPVFKSDGSYACSTCVDFSLDRLSQEDNTFTLRLMLTVLGAAAIILALEVLVVRKWVTNPIDRLSRCAEGFAYATEEDRKNNIELLDKVDIRNRDEIGAVYQMLRSVTIDSFQSTSSLTRAKQDIQDKESRISAISREAYKDNLTRVGNLAAFKRDTEDLNGEFGFVMFDLNNLKIVNDGCGHDKGDVFIKGCCAIICKQYKHSPVYRVGGDEFIVLLRGEDYLNREQHLSDVRATFQNAYESEAEPWEKYSASAGMAVRMDEEEASQVLKRADEAMYAEKEAFRKKTGISRPT